MWHSTSPAQAHTRWIGSQCLRLQWSRRRTWSRRCPGPWWCSCSVDRWAASMGVGGMGGQVRGGLTGRSASCASCAVGSLIIAPCTAPIPHPPVAGVALQCKKSGGVSMPCERCVAASPAAIIPRGRGHVQAPQPPVSPSLRPPSPVPRRTWELVVHAAHAVPGLLMLSMNSLEKGRGQPAGQGTYTGRSAWRGRRLRSWRMPAHALLAQGSVPQDRGPAAAAPQATHHGFLSSQVTAPPPLWRHPGPVSA